jgi:hypothetical protein
MNNALTIAIIRYVSLVGLGVACLITPTTPAVSAKQHATPRISSAPPSAIMIAQEVPTTLQQGMAYAEAREILIEAGWQAIEISPMQRESQSDTVSYLMELGYNEVVDCAGTGMGFCRLEFATAEGQTLAIVTVNNQRGDEPTLYRWMLEESNAPLSP